MPSSIHELSIVIPTKDSGYRLNRVLTSLNSLEEDNPGTIELVLVDDGSNSDSRRDLLELARKNAKMCIRLVMVSKNLGQFLATRIGIIESTGQRILTVDDDLVISRDSVQEMVSLLDSENLDFVVARYETEYMGQKWIRRLGSRLSTSLVRRVYGIPRKHYLSSTILFEAGYIRPLAKSSDVRTRPAWFYAFSQYYSNVTIRLEQIERTSHYNFARLFRAVKLIWELPKASLVRYLAVLLTFLAFASLVATAIFILISSGAGAPLIPAGFRTLLSLGVIIIALNIINLLHVWSLSIRVLEIEPKYYAYRVLELPSLSHRNSQSNSL